MCQEFGIENEIIPKIATCFGGGIGGSGNICGAASGAVMAIGLIRKQFTSVEEWQETAGVARTFLQRFEDEAGSLNCRELTQLDLTSDEGRNSLMNSEVAMTVCFPAVARAFDIVMELLEAERQAKG